MVIVKLSLTEDAWELLAQSAMQLAWIRAMNTSSFPGGATRNINRFFAALSVLEYEDVRPDHLRGSCVWIKGERARQHKLVMRSDAIANLATLAVEHRIPPRFHQFHALYERLPMAPLTNEAYAWAVTASTAPALSAALLEAIGLRWLRPIGGFPLAPRTLFARPPKPKLLPNISF